MRFEIECEEFTRASSRLVIRRMMRRRNSSRFASRNQIITRFGALSALAQFVSRATQDDFARCRFCETALAS